MNAPTTGPVRPVGKLFVFEGRNRAGKTTLSRSFAERLRTQGVACEYLAFPGRTVGTLGELVHRLHRRPDEFGVEAIHPTSLQMLHVAAHIDEIHARIGPALLSGASVVLDRFWWSTWVYGEILGADPEALRAMIAIERTHWDNLQPTAIFLVEREPAPGEEMSDFDRKIAQKYRQTADEQKFAQRVVSLDNSGSLEATLNAICQVTREDLLQSSTAVTLATTPETRQDELFSGQEADLPRGPEILLKLPPARPTKVFETYWRFAAERQEIFFRRIDTQNGWWTDDPILSVYKFTNAYRASDRVSQFLIRNVIYAGEQSPQEIFFRVLLFKLFNRIETWHLMKDSLGAPSLRRYSFETYDRVLSEAIDSGRRLYSAAYIMPSGGRASSELGRKHRMHLRLLERMLNEGLPEQLDGAASMKEAFIMLRNYPTIGDFLAYQYITDLNYSDWLKFDEMSFVVPGPGALSGIEKCFSDLGGRSEAQIIEMVAAHQDEHLEKLGINFKTLWGRKLQLIDCQNLFCEVDKYARVFYPEIIGRAGRTRIKQRHVPRHEPIAYWYPPKWGLNDLLPSDILPGNVPHLRSADGQPDLAPSGRRVA